MQADEIKVKAQAGSFWMALAMMVPTRLWLGGAISPRRDLSLIEKVAMQIRQVALCQPLLLAVDGLPGYVKAFGRAFRTPFQEKGSGGRPRLIAWPDIAIVQVVKQRSNQTLTIQRRIVQGSETMVHQLLHLSQGGGVINTAFIERLNATFLKCLPRSGLPPSREEGHHGRLSDSFNSGVNVHD